MVSIDLNVDVGEGVANEKALLPLLSSCNIACGGHFGDENSMRSVIQLAKKYNVKIGAHPSFPDKENFGREIVKMSSTALFHTIKNQIELLQSIARKEQIMLHHVKPHGALYNLAAKDKTTAMVVVEVMKRFHQPIKLYVPYKSVIADVALKENIQIVYEAFADRNYNEDLSLVSRKEKNALISDPDFMYEHVYNMVTRHKVKTITNSEVSIQASTFCVHGDTMNAVELTSSLKKQLEASNILIQ